MISIDVIYTIIGVIILKFAFEERNKKIRIFLFLSGMLLIKYVQIFGNPLK